MGLEIPLFLRTFFKLLLPLFVSTLIFSLIFFNHFVREQDIWTITSVYYLAIQIYGNWVQVWRHRTKEADIPPGNGFDRFECKQCKRVHGALMHYCPLCDACTFRHDKHCIFVGTCVGFKNRMYFIGFCTFASIGSLYALMVYYSYFRSVHPSKEISLFSSFFPIALFQFVTGQADVITLMFSFLFYFLVVVIGFTTALVFWQLSAFRKFSKKMVAKKDTVHFDSFLVFEPKYDLWNLVVPFASDFVRRKRKPMLPCVNSDI